MFVKSIAILVILACIYVQAIHGKPGSQVADKLANDNKCMCGNWLGLHCGLRSSDTDCDPTGKVVLYGKGCEKNGFYQCSEINQPATFKGFCPNCRVISPGQDQCLSPTALAADGDCICGNWLGLHCGLRYEGDGGDGGDDGGDGCRAQKEAKLWGNCEKDGFYQCSEIQQKATFKGFCPNCRVVSPGQDVCLSPTGQDKIKTLFLH